jgi:hypothetical protein
MKILEFLGILVAGFLLLYYAYPITNLVGRQDWIERYLGPGGTITAFRLAGVILCIFAFIFLINF